MECAPGFRTWKSRAEGMRPGSEVAAGPERYLLEGNEPCVERQHGHASCHGVQVDLCPVHIRAVPALLPEVALAHCLVEQRQRLHAQSSLLKPRRPSVYMSHAQVLHCHHRLQQMCIAASQVDQTRHFLYEPHPSKLDDLISTWALLVFVQDQQDCFDLRTLGPSTLTKTIFFIARQHLHSMQTQGSASLDSIGSNLGGGRTPCAAPR